MKEVGSWLPQPALGVGPKYSWPSSDVGPMQCWSIKWVGPLSRTLHATQTLFFLLFFAVIELAVPMLAWALYSYGPACWRGPRFQVLVENGGIGKPL